MSSTCKRLDLQTLGSQAVLPKNFPNLWGARGELTGGFEKSPVEFHNIV